MKAEHRFVAPASRDQVWELMQDMVALGRCFPGVEQVEAEDGASYRGTMRIRLGPVSLNIAGTITVIEMDKERWHAAMRLQGTDRRLGGGMSGTMVVELVENSPTETELVVSSDISFLGKLGELGQPIIRRKADSILREFAHNLGKVVSPQ